EDCHADQRAGKHSSHGSSPNNHVSGHRSFAALYGSRLAGGLARRVIAKGCRRTARRASPHAKQTVNRREIVL
ncbi:MAG TPA: hypothetical protein VMY42_13885, partial [Thermoguttaceae bacterium]|nr:hypothetical protein [Thermoguttaceae bacterium]